MNLIATRKTIARGLIYLNTVIIVLIGAGFFWTAIKAGLGLLKHSILYYGVPFIIGMALYFSARNLRSKEKYIGSIVTSVIAALFLGLVCFMNNLPYIVTLFDL